MSGEETPAQIHEVARQAIDEDALAEVLELTAGEACEADAVAALQEVIADEIVADAVAAAQRARRRGRLPTGDDVGDAADDRRVCYPPEVKNRPLKPAYTEIERS